MLPTAGAGADGLVRTRPEVASPRPVAERLLDERFPSEPSLDWPTDCSATPLGAACKTVACEKKTVPSAVCWAEGVPCEPSLVTGDLLLLGPACPAAPRTLPKAAPAEELPGVETKF